MVFIAGPNSEMDWLTFNWDEDLKNYVGALTESVDTIVLGRKLAQGFIPHWAANPELEGADTINATPKVVFTKTLPESDWANTVLATGDLMDELTTLKEQAGQDIIVYGGATFVSALIKHNLIDEYHLFVNPAAIGNGLAIFRDIDHTQRLTLVDAKPFACGIVVLHYVSKTT
ncbi:dihydrofolate reductase family protein [Spirosoma sp. KUDC1026]|uniref:dihydrofolate reductase family protein n=1 Tax=Spirosoma sp. KUDC1026 TaxID=2745947 RepID=UPI001C3FE14B|nr:dihydrofolate reductase family protein [Spirosoma sp. KUDC1026]